MRVGGKLDGARRLAVRRVDMESENGRGKYPPNSVFQRFERLWPQGRGHAEKGRRGGGGGDSSDSSAGGRLAG